MAVEALLVGLVLGFSLAAPPGPVLAQLAFETARGRWKTGLAVGLGATTADGTFFVLTYLGLLRVVPGARTLATLALGGTLLMLYFARGAWLAARLPLDATPRRLTGFAGGFLIAALSPFNLAWWVTSGAPILARHGPLLALGFFPAILAVVVASVVVVRLGASRFARFERYVSYTSALFLAGFAVYLLAHALTTLL